MFKREHLVPWIAKTAISKTILANESCAESVIEISCTAYDGVGSWVGAARSRACRNGGFGGGVCRWRRLSVFDLEVPWA